MPYCTQSDILEQLPEEELIAVTDDNGLGEVDASAVARAIADGDAEIDTYCGGRYTVPFTTVPAIIRKLSVDLAIYHLYGRRKGTLPEERKGRYESAVRLLRDIAKDLVTLGVSDPAPTSDDGVEITTSRTDRKFTIGRGSTAGTLDNY
jgi:phage gp36-like protein